MFDINNPVEKSISAALHTKRFPHAVIFEGSGVEERMALAKKTACALVCSSGGIVPCGVCQNCKKAMADSHADILIYSVEDKPKAFKVDIVREIRSKAYIVPNEADRKVFILENSHTMGVEGQNAILKILEEPPTYVNFILLCSSKSGFLPTVLSRSAVYNLGEAYSSGNDDLPREKVLAAASGIAKAVTAMSDIEIVKAASVFEKDQKLLRAALPVIQEIFAAALRIKYSAADGDEEFGEIPSELSSKLTRRSLLELIEASDSLMNSLKLNANHNLMVTAVCTKLRSIRR
ncbi:MAG: ATP-binding protein [Clostridia bacterium]|nr:ATP-binding protein [Clostridia bacterium]